MKIRQCIAFSSILFSSPCFAQAAIVAPTQSVVAPETPAPCCVIPALSEVRIEFLSTVNSQANQIGEHFPIRLADPIVIDGKELVPAGSTGSGDVIHAAKSRFGGKAGELILAVRYIDYNGTRIPLRSLRYATRHGEDRGDTAAVVAIAGGAVGGVIAMFITGGEVNIPTGTVALAKTAEAVTIAPATVTQSVQTPEPKEGALKQ